MEKVGVCLLTSTRTELAVRTIRHLRTHLLYPNVGWYVACDNGPRPHFDAVMAELADADILGYHFDTVGPGPSWNLAWRRTVEKVAHVLWLEDDWDLLRPTDITPYVNLLTENADVGMVRLSHLAVGLHAHTVGFAGRHYLNLQKTTQYAYSGNPHLRHRRYFEAYGGYPEEGDPGICEVWHDSQIREKEGPQIWWPIDIGGWGLFGHTGIGHSYQ